MGDIFRYVPQIEQVGLDKEINRRVIMQLLERDRQLEDYLSNLTIGAGVSLAKLTAASQSVPNASLEVVHFNAVDPGVGTPSWLSPAASTGYWLLDPGTYTVTASVLLTNPNGSANLWRINAWASTWSGSSARQQAPMSGTTDTPQYLTVADLVTGTTEIELGIEVQHFAGVAASVLGQVLSIAKLG